MSKSFSDRLRLIRGDRTQAEFARELGIPAPMYHRYERGQVPKSDNLRVIAEKCDTTVDWLLTGIDKGHVPPDDHSDNGRELPAGATNTLEIQAWREKAKRLDAMMGQAKDADTRLAALESRVSILEQHLLKLTAHQAPPAEKPNESRT